MDASSALSTLPLSLHLFPCHAQQKALTGELDLPVLCPTPVKIPPLDNHANPKYS